MDLIVNNPLFPVLSVCAVVAIGLAIAAWITRSAWLSTVAAPIVFLVAWVVTYRRVPTFPPVDASDTIFSVALAATVGVLALDLFVRVPRWLDPFTSRHGAFVPVPRVMMAVMTALLAAAWTGWSKLGAETTMLPFLGLVLGGGFALWCLDRAGKPGSASGDGGTALICLAAVSVLSAPTLLYGGSPAGLALGLAAGAAVLSMENMAHRRILRPAAMLGAGSGLLAALDTIAFVTRRADSYALALIAIAPVLGPWAVSLLPQGLRNRPAVVWIVAGLGALSPLPLILAILVLRHGDPPRL